VTNRHVSSQPCPILIGQGPASTKSWDPPTYDHMWMTHSNQISHDDQTRREEKFLIFVTRLLRGDLSAVTNLLVYND